MRGGCTHLKLITVCFKRIIKLTIVVGWVFYLQYGIAPFNSFIAKACYQLYVVTTPWVEAVICVVEIILQCKAYAVYINYSRQLFIGDNKRCICLPHTRALCLNIYHARLVGRQYVLHTSLRIDVYVS